MNKYKVKKIWNRIAAIVKKSQAADILWIYPLMKMGVPINTSQHIS